MAEARSTLQSPIVRYTLAVAAVSIALGARLLLGRLNVPTSPFLLFCAAILVAAIFGGLGPGLLATALAAVASNYFFMSPYFALQVNDPSERIQLTFFLAEGAIISGLNAGLRATHRRAEANERAARELERRILQVSEAEQRRIGRDLHDGLGQHLTGVALLAQSLCQNLEVEGSVQAGEARRVEALVSQAIAWTRDLASNLSPAAVEGGRLAPALQDLAEGASTLLNVHCTFCDECEDDAVVVDETTAVHVYRIAQEAISNAVKHGKARSVVVRLIPEAQTLSLQVESDGASFPAGDGATADGKGMGLKTMRYRARAIGGSLALASRGGVGTVVTCRFPRHGRSI